MNFGVQFPLLAQVLVKFCLLEKFLMACVLIGERKLKAGNSNPETPEKKVQRGFASSDELMVDSSRA